MTKIQWIVDADERPSNDRIKHGRAMYTVTWVKIGKGWLGEIDLDEHSGSGMYKDMSIDEMLIELDENGMNLEHEAVQRIKELLSVIADD